MTREQQTFEFPPEFRALGEEGVLQARKAFDGFCAVTQHALATLEGQTSAAQAGVRNLQRHALGFAERNIAASLDFVQKLMQARDVTDLMRLHAAQMAAQIDVISEQMREFGRIASQAMGGEPGNRAPR